MSHRERSRTFIETWNVACLFLSCPCRESIIYSLQDDIFTVVFSVEIKFYDWQRIKNSCLDGQCLLCTDECNTRQHLTDRISCFISQCSTANDSLCNRCAVLTIERAWDWNWVCLCFATPDAICLLCWHQSDGPAQKGFHIAHCQGGKKVGQFPKSISF